MDEFGDLVACADVVICRAGANSIYELLVCRKPHILIPLSAKASRGDQLMNAETFQQLGFSREPVDGEDKSQRHKRQYHRTNFRLHLHSFSIVATPSTCVAPCSIKLKYAFFVTIT